MKINVARTPVPIRLSAKALRRRFNEDIAASHYTNSWSIDQGRLTISLTSCVYLRPDRQEGSVAGRDPVHHEEPYERDFRGLAPLPAPAPAPLGGFAPDPRPRRRSCATGWRGWRTGSASPRATITGVWDRWRRSAGTVRTEGSCRVDW